MFRRLLVALPLVFLAPIAARPLVESPPTPAKVPPASGIPADALDGFKFRNIGPALFSGRVVGFAFHPRDKSHFYAAVASGGVWKTVNGGDSWTPVFDEQGSYSVGCVVIDPKDPQTVWVGTGENNSQRSVGYGDGVYRSRDGGKTWKNVGLAGCQHVGKILLDPRDSRVVYVAAQGPLWNTGGDRGLYRSSDGGDTWTRLLHVNDDTGVTDIVCDPRNPDILLAASHQRRRHVWTLINGGPGSALHRSTDAGKTWVKVTSGLPTVELGRIGLAVAPTRPDTVYATVEAADGKGGVFRSLDKGRTWERRNPFDQVAMYYGNLFVDPVDAERVYVMNTLVQLSDDGGKTLKPLPMKGVHVDCHALWIDPADPKHYVLGCDGGVYVSLDRAATWRHIRNLPVTQFYDITIDNAYPFYNVYGGTQDNCTLGGPARTRSSHGITNADWFTVHFGDGFQCKVDPRDPNTVYGEAQYGDLVRYDRRTGQSVGIRPYLPPSEKPLRWNWDSPLVLSSHAPTRLYFAANRVFRTDDRGESWKAISPDLTRQLDRDKLPVMGRRWGVDAIYRHGSTSLFGNLVALCESPKDADLLYAGTDDGLIQVTEDAKTWRKIDRFPGVPAQTYVSRIVASRHEADAVYACFNNHKNGDFVPYLLRSADRGKTWASIAGDLPKNGSVWCVVEDPVRSNLLFVGTEFGLYFTLDQGKTWSRLKAGLPTIAVRDLAIHEKCGDLVVGTFGRGIYVLDDYTPLRQLAAITKAAAPALLGVREAHLYIPTRQYALAGKAFLGEAFFAADNPAFGASLGYYLPETIQTRKQKRQEADKKAGDRPTIPTPEELRAEDSEEPPAVVLEILAGDDVIRRMTGPVKRGVHRLAWNLREAAPVLASPPPNDEEALYRQSDSGPVVVPGTYRVRLSIRQGGKLRPVEGEQAFTVAPLDATPTLAGHKERHAFDRKLDALRRSLDAAQRTADDLQKRLTAARNALDQAPAAKPADRDLVVSTEAKLRDIVRALRGDGSLRKRNENTPDSVADRVGAVRSERRFTLFPPSATHQRLHDDAESGLAIETKKLKGLLDKEMKAINGVLDAAKAPWTPGRGPGA